MRNGSWLLRRDQLWSLLFGVLGAYCSSDLLAAQSRLSTDEVSTTSGGEAPLRLTKSLADTVENSAFKSRSGGRKLPDPILRLETSLPIRQRVSGAVVSARESARRSPPVHRDDALDVAMSRAAPAVSPIAGSGRSGVRKSSETFRTGDGLLAALDEPEAPVPFDPQPAGTAARPAAGRNERPGAAKRNTGQGDLPDLSGESWRMAPIRWAGNTSTGGNYFQTGDGSNNLSILNSLNLQASSFIVAPYIAQWSGMLGANSTATTYTPARGAKVESDSSSMNYGASVNVFPLSRFPFSASINHGTSLSKTADSSSPTSNTTLGLRQQYRTEDGRDNYALSYSRNSLNSEVAGIANSNVFSSLGGSFATSREIEFESLLGGNHSFSTNFATSSATADSSGQKSQVFNVNANHGWVVHEDLSLSSMLTFARNQIQSYQGNLLTENNSNVFLGTTGFTWRPWEDLPLTFTGGGNISRTLTESGIASSEMQTLGGFVGTSYRFNANLSASGNASITSTTSSGVRNISNSQNANLSYSGDPMKFMDFTYGWGVGGGVTRNASTLGGGVNASASASHNLGRAIVLNERSSINLNASQNLTQTSGDRASTNLSNMLAAAWSANYGEKLTTTLSANVMDTVSTGTGSTNHFRSASLVGTGLYQLSSRASVTLNANLSWSQALTGSSDNQALNGVIVDTAAPVTSGSIFVGYSHQSPFSIRNLTYNANLLFVNSVSNQRVLGGDVQASNSQASNTFQQAVDYRLGRLSFRLNHSMINQAGRKSASIFGSVNRDFDGFFDGRW